MKNRVVYSGLLLLFVTGMLITIMHYMPRPSAEIVINNNIQPGVKWFIQQMALYSDNAVMTFLHVTPAFIFMIIAPFQIWPSFRQNNSKAHQLMGKVFVINSIFIFISSLYIAVVMPFAGIDETIVSFVIAALFITFLTLGIVKIKQKDIAAHREWMCRMLAMGLVPVTMRFFYSAMLIAFPKIDSTTVFSPALWMGLVVNWIIIELWLNHTRKQKLIYTS